MRNGKRLLITLVLVVQSTGCAMLVSSSKPSSFMTEKTDPATTSTANDPNNIKHPADASTRALKPAIHRAPVVLAPTLELDAKPTKAEIRRQRDQRYAQVEKEVISRFERQQQHRHIWQQPELIQTQPPPQSEMDQASYVDAIESTTPVEQIAVAPLEMGSFPSRDILCQPAAMSSWLEVGGRPFTFIVTAVLVLSGMTWPLTRLQRRSIPVLNSDTRSGARSDFQIDARTESQSKHLKSEYPNVETTDPASLIWKSNSESLQSLVAESNSLYCVDWGAIDCSEYCVVIDLQAFDPAPLTLNESSLAPKKLEIAPVQNSTETARFTLALLKLSDKVTQKQANLPPHFETPSSETKGVTRQLCLVPQQGSIQSKEMIVTSPVANLVRSGQVRVGSSINNQLSSPVRQVSHHGSQQIGKPRDVIGIVVLFADNGDMETNKQLMLVESYHLNDQSELIARVVRVA